MYRPVVLIVLDGWGLNDNPANILKTLPLPTMTKLQQFYPMTALQASGISVGLPWGEAGNSEVGHMTMGAGKVIYQNLPRISLATQDGSFDANPALGKAITKVKESGGALHLMGLVSDGAVHAHRDHLYALLALAKKEGLTKVFVHAFTDGRDSSPTSGVDALAELQKRIDSIGVGKIATLIGRNWAMDRNNNWDRIQKAYDMLTKGTGAKVTNPEEYLRASYSTEITDEYLEPGVIYEGDAPLTTIKDGDSVIFFNFREDRARELTKAFTLPSFEKFDRGPGLDLTFVTMTEYESDLPLDIAFPPQDVVGTLGEILSASNKKQARIAETEKYAHVTYFFNGGREDPWPHEDRILTPSPAVERFDEKPEMSSYEITDKCIEAVQSNKYDFILINYANADMVAHTGNQEAAGKAAISIDACMNKLLPVIINAGGCALITADHGNIEVMQEPHGGGVDTEHNASPIPLWYITPHNHRKKDQKTMVRDATEVRGLLSDVAPTILEIMGLPKPPDMHGESLLEILK